MDKKKLSKQHEDYIARLYDGKRSLSSGASISDKGDVRSRSLNTLFECKMAGEPGRPKRSALVKHMEKVADEAWAEAREPAVCLRFFDPDSPLANRDGWVDLTIRLTSDDVIRERARGD